MGKKTRTEYSFLNIVTGLGGYVLNLILGLICRMVFTRTLAVEYLGVSGLFSNILSMLSLAELGIGSAIVFALYKPLAQDDRPKIASLVQFYGKCYRVIGITVAVIGASLIPFLHLLIDEPNIKENIYLLYGLYLFNAASSYFFSYRASLLMAAQRNYLVTGIGYLFTITQSVLQTIWLFATHEYIGYLIIQFLGTFAYNITVSLIAKKEYPYIADKGIQPIEREERNRLVRNVRALVIWKLCGLLVNSTDNIIITYFNGLIAVGLASNYTLLSGTLNSLINLFFNGLTASVGNHNAQEDTEHKYALFKSINLANFWMFGWASIGIFVCSSDMVQLLFGSHYVLPIKIPFIIALNFYMVGMQSAVWMYKNTMGIFHQGRYLLLLTAAINLVASIWLGKLLGLFGILVATAISRACTNTWFDPYAIHKYGFGISVRPYYLRYLAFAALCAATGALCYGLCALLPFSLLINVILKIVICSAVCNGVFFLCFHRSAEFKYLWGFAGRVLSRLSVVLHRR
ncbi:MAG: hypothetical protein IKO00_02435 [Oscillospiraceae bacterium]|nr:hypothetical protein [Oscillospiraceae bacterium]